MYKINSLEWINTEFKRHRADTVFTINTVDFKNIFNSTQLKNYIIRFTAAIKFFPIYLVIINITRKIIYVNEKQVINGSNTHTRMHTHKHKHENLFCRKALSGKYLP